MSIRDNILNIKDEIGDKAKLVAVSKTRSTEEINDAYNSGHKIFKLEFFNLILSYSSLILLNSSIIFSFS